MSKKPKKKRISKQKGLPNEGKQFPGLLWRLLVLGLLSALLFIIFLLPPPKKDLSKARPALEEPIPAPSKPTLKQPPLPIKTPKPLVAIIIDDMGFNYPLDMAFIKLPAPLSFAFLPYAPYTKELATIAAKEGKDVLVHMPMEPKSMKADPGPGAIYTSMDLSTIKARLNEAFEKVPYAIGLNNHMGSKLTSDLRTMHIVMAELKKKDMIFIDSRTSKETVAYKAAKATGVKSAERDIFLDHSHKYEDIVKAIKDLVKVAHKQGWAIAIGHPQETTYRVLYSYLPLLQKKVKIVPIKQLIKERTHINEIWRRGDKTRKARTLAKP